MPFHRSPIELTAQKCPPTEPVVGGTTSQSRFWQRDCCRLQSTSMTLRSPWGLQLEVSYHFYREYLFPRPWHQCLEWPKVSKAASRIAGGSVPPPKVARAVCPNKYLHRETANEEGQNRLVLRRTLAPLRKSPDEN